MPKLQVVHINPKSIQDPSIEQIEYDFSTDKLFDVLKTKYPTINKQNKAILLENELLMDWDLPISICKIYSNRILLCDQTVKYSILKLNKKRLDFEINISPTLNIYELIELLETKQGIQLEISIDCDLKDLVCDVANRCKQNTVAFKECESKKIDIFVTVKGKKIEFRGINRTMLVKDLKIIIQNREGISVQKQQIKFSGDTLSDNRQLEYYDIESGSVLVLSVIFREGSLGMSNFVDVSNNKGPKKISWSSDAPEWRRAKRGLCIEGKCTNEKCQACACYVVISMGDNISYELNSPSFATNCPVCDQYVQPETVALNNCNWRFIAIKQTSRGPKNIKSDWKLSDDNYYRFDPDENGVSHWFQLAFECKAISGDSPITTELESKLPLQYSKSVLDFIHTNDNIVRKTIY